MVDYKRRADEEFERCRQSKLRPPVIIPLPDHVVWSGADGLRIRCPLAAAGGLGDEAANDEAALKLKLRANPGDSELCSWRADVQKHRRAPMRKVPKGRNLQENIVTCASGARALAYNACRIVGVNARLSGDGAAH